MLWSSQEAISEQQEPFSPTASLGGALQGSLLVSRREKGRKSSLISTEAIDPHPSLSFFGTSAVCCKIIQYF